MRVRRAVGVAVALSLTGTASGCGVFSSDDEVVLLGDSITVLIGDAVTKAAPDGIDIEVAGDWGKRADEQLGTARQLGDDDPAQVIVNLGTNNVLQRHDLTATANDLAAILDDFDGSGCLHLVTINEHITGMGQDFGPAATELNRQIRTLAERRLDTDVIDWNQIVVDHTADPVIADDGIHPNARGIELLAAAYVDAIGRC